MFAPIAHGNAQPGDMLALDIHGTPARSAASINRMARVAAVEILPGDRARVMLESGRTITQSVAVPVIVGRVSA